MRLVNPLLRSPEVPKTSAGSADSADGSGSADDADCAGSANSAASAVGAEGPAPLRTTEQTVVATVAAAILALSVLLRFWTPSPMWLDEALTVNIAKAPLHAIPHLLRDDGAPPLFYFLLHFWMKLFGTSDLGARSLSGVIGVISLPAAWWAGYRVGSQSWRSSGAVDQQKGRLVAWTTTLLVATSPFAVYYDTEARMYSLVILLSTLGVVAYVGVLRRPTIWNSAALAALTCALLYSHYWALFFVAACAAGTAFRARSGRYAHCCRVALLALALGALAFVPWVPTFWFQLHHTGTPWATPADFTALVYTFTQFAGGNSDAGRGLALVFAFLALLAVAGSALDGQRVVIDLRTRPGVRALALVTAGTLLIAVVAGKLTGSTFADRYSAVILLPCLLVVAYGVTVLADRRVQRGAIALAIALGLAASIPNAFLRRTQAGQVASAVLARAHAGDVVAVCPDQLGPAVSRELGDRFDELAFPRGNSPAIVDWVDYASTVRHASTTRFVKLLESRAGPRNAIWYVWAPGYLSFGNDCQAIANRLAADRPEQTVVPEQASDTPFEIFEGESLDRFARP